MSHFYERILGKDLDLSEELEKLKTIFEQEEEYLYDINGFESLYSYVNKVYFRQLPLSYNYIDISEFFSDALVDAKDEKEMYIFYCEAIYTIINQLINSKRRPNVKDVEWINRQISSIERIVKTNANKLNLVAKEIETDIGTVTTFIPNDAMLEKTLEEIEDSNIQNYLIEYASSRTNGNIKRKEELLKLLATTVEGITKQDKFKNKFKQLCSNADLLYNKLDLRHNIKVKDRRYYDETLSDREKWLDLTFRETLLVLNLDKHYDDLEAVEKLKQKIETV